MKITGENSNKEEEEEKEEINRRECSGETEKDRRDRPLGESESIRDTGEIQPIRDEMELLESERRILSPGCCTGEREKERERERGEGRGRELRTMHHAILLFYLKENEKI